MSNNDLPETHRTGSLQELKIEGDRSRSHSSASSEKRPKKMSSRSNDFVYVNPSYVGSIDSVAEHPRPQESPTRVIREQYWTCSRWPYAQRFLAIAVGILVGTVIGLAVTVVLTDRRPNDMVNNLFQRSIAPD